MEYLGLPQPLSLPRPDKVSARLPHILVSWKTENAGYSPCMPRLARLPGAAAMRFWLISNKVERSMASTDPTSLGTRNEGYPSFMMILAQTPTNNRGKQLKIGARIVRHGRYVVFQLA